MIARDRTTGDSVTYAPPSITTSMSCASSRPSCESPVRCRTRGVPLGGGGHVLAAVVDQLHRPAALQRQQGRVQGDVGREFFLAAEPATGGRLDHPHSGLVARERVLQRLEDVVETLHRALHHQHVALEIGDHPLSLEVDVLLCAGLVRARDDHRSLRERTLHIALHYLEVLEDVVRAVLDLVGGGGGGGGGPEVEGG